MTSKGYSRKPDFRCTFTRNHCLAPSANLHGFDHIPIYIASYREWTFRTESNEALLISGTSLQARWISSGTPVHSLFMSANKSSTVRLFSLVA